MTLLNYHAHASSGAIWNTRENLWESTVPMVIISEHNIGYNHAGSWSVSFMQTIDLVLWLRIQEMLFPVSIHV